MLGLGGVKEDGRFSCGCVTVLFFGVLSFVLGCLDGDGGLNLRTPEEQAFAAAYTQIGCDMTRNCCAVLGHPGATGLGCEHKAVTDLRTQRLGPFFNPLRAALCLAVLRKQLEECVFAPFDSFAACAGVWSKGAAAGASCDLPGDCRETDGHLVECDGVCAEIRTASSGEVCNLDRDAAHIIRTCGESSGLFCDQTTQVSSGVCLVRRIEGEPCVTSARDENCAEGLYCTGLKGTCQPVVERGGACLGSGGQACGVEASCFNDVCHRTRNPGASCEPLTDSCLLGACQGGHCAVDTPFCT